MDGNLAADAAQDIDRILWIRRARSEVFGPGLFSDPAWDILLQLCAARARGRRLGIEDIVADVPRSTLARWAAVLEQRGLICREEDSGDPARIWLSLSASGALKMAELLARLRPLQSV